VSAHLILGNLFAALAAVTSATLARGRDASTPQTPALPKVLRPLLGLWTASVLLQFVLGGIIAGNIAGLVCTEFPTCNGGVWFPSFTGFVGAQVLHRLNAYLLLLTALSLAWTARHLPRLATPTKALVGLVLLQGTVGAINIVSYLHTAVTTAHSLLAALVFSATAWLWTRLRA
jgi:cytochrome c oxidase assembly protein subunit 15